MTKYRVPRRPVLCMGCGHEWLSQAERPKCSDCGSYQVINQKDAPEKYDILKLRADTNKRLNEFSEEFHQLRMNIQELVNGYKYLKEAHDALKERVEELELMAKATNGTKKDFTPYTNNPKKGL